MDGVHRRLEGQRGVGGALEQLLEHLAHRRTRDGDENLAAVAGDGQFLVDVGGDDEAGVAVGANPAFAGGELLLAVQGQAEAVAVERGFVADADSDVGAVFDDTHLGGHALEHTA